jgi:hypothetical protein
MGRRSLSGGRSPDATRSAKIGASANLVGKLERSVITSGPAR